MENKIEVILATKSEVKYKAVKSFFSKKNLKKDFEIKERINVKSPELIEQPVNTAFDCLKIRFKITKKILKQKKIDLKNKLILGIENAIVTNDKKNDAKDICHILIEYNNKFYKGISFGINLPEKFYNILLKEKKREMGYDITLGEIIHNSNNKIPKDNWMKDLYGIDRNGQILDALENCFENINF